MDSISLEMNDVITALAYDFMTTGRYVDDALEYIEGHLNPGEDIDSFKFFVSDDFPYLSKLFDSFNSSGLGTKEYYLNLINKLWEYQDNPEANYKFRDKIYASVFENPQIAAFVLCNRETEGIIEKDIISRLISSSKDTSDFNYTVFSGVIRDLIDDNSWKGYRNFDWRSFDLNKKLEQMRSYGLLEYEDMYSKEGITVTDLGRSVYDVFDNLHFSRAIVWASENRMLNSITSIGYGALSENNLMTSGIEKTAEEIEPSVDDDESLPESSEMDVMYPAVGPLLIEGSEPLKFSPADVSNFLALRYLPESENAEPGLNLPDVVRPVLSFMSKENPDVWSTEYEGREFPYGVLVNGNVELALDEGRENVIEVLNHDGRMSEEYLSFLCTFFASDYNAIAGKVCQNGEGKTFYDTMSSLLDKELISKDKFGFVPGSKSDYALNYGLNLLLTLPEYKHIEYTDREIGIIEALSLRDDVMDKIKYM